MKIHWIVSILIMFSVMSCAVTNQTTPNYANMYSQSGGQALNPSYLIYHSSKEITELYFKFESDKILYARKDKSKPFQAKISLHYRIYNEGTNNAKNLLDSATTFVEDEMPVKTKKSIYGQIPLKLALGKNYRIYLQFKDINKNTIHETFINVNKTDLADKNFFMLSETVSGKPVFESFLTNNQRLILNSVMNSGKTVFAHYYQREFSIAAPPFGSMNYTPFQYKPDVALTYQFDEAGKHEFDMHNKGFVHFLVDTTQKKGFTLYRYDYNFPMIQSAVGMVSPLKYICTKAEFESISAAENPKLALDEFWIARSGTKDRAREIIKIFYNRVQDANLMFSSYIEGWKTDRGMISLIFGLPKTVRRDFNQEVWVYGEETNVMSLQFIFTKVENPFSTEDYKLQRSLNYKTNWYRAVDAWRSGRVYWAQ